MAAWSGALFDAADAPASFAKRGAVEMARRPAREIRICPVPTRLSSALGDAHADLTPLMFNTPSLENPRPVGPTCVPTKLKEGRPEIT
jgi:hypothetical protein